MGCGASAKTEEEKQAELEEKQAEFEEATGTGVSPSLQEYFQGLDTFTTTEITLLKELHSLKYPENGEFDKEAHTAKFAELKAKRMEWKNLSGRVLGEVFSYYDKSGGQDNCLNTEESKNLFAALTSEKAAYDAILANAQARKAMSAELGFSRNVFEGIELQNEEELQAGVEKIYKEEVDAHLKAIEEKKVAVLDDYRTNKSTRDQAAFLVLDTGNDGHIQKAEFLAAFDPTSNVYDGFMTALGFPDA